MLADDEAMQSGIEQYHLKWKFIWYFKSHFVFNSTKIGLNSIVQKILLIDIGVLAAYLTTDYTYKHSWALNITQ